ncbi:MAG: DUF11 domain-containing protein [Solirubrobacterales bacterium]
MALASAVVFCLPASASAQIAEGEPDGKGTDMFVTVAARECPTYDAIRANLARNNIMESLQDLGKDTLYTSGEPINPLKELRGQPLCKPISGWTFTVGSGIKEKAVSGPWGSLSIVTGAEETPILTEASTPLRGWGGQLIPDISIRGATTFELNQAQAERAGRNSLWIQGGTTTDPVLFNQAPFVGKYGFGALRCSIDDLNGDNVETIAFPTGPRHAFCHAYYVTPPPASGTIVIRKEVKGSGADPQAFDFGGNVSYNPGGAFSLSAANGKPDEETFFRGETRAGEDPWTVSEDVPKGWVLANIRCEAGASAVTTSLKAKEVSIRLAPGDTVTCTYVDVLRPPKGGLLLRKVTENGIGSFDFKILDSGGNVVKRSSIGTRSKGLPAYSKPLLLDPGTYRVFEKSPSDRRGVWKLVDVSCNGTARNGNGASVAITDKSGVLCTFTNRLAYEGRLSIRKETIGNTGTALFQVTAPADPTLELHQRAKVKREGVAVRAHGNSTGHLPYGLYVIQESAAGEVENGHWSLIEVICDGRAVPFEQGRAVVRLTQRDPTASCKFVNRFAKGPVPPPPGPEPRPGEEAELVVAKELIRSGGGPTPTEVFRITVANPSKVPATNVVVTDQPGRGLAIVSAEPSQGECFQATEYSCALGTIPAGGKATVIVTARDYSADGTYNSVVAGSASAEEKQSNNVARVAVRKVRRPATACGSRVAVAHASC